MKPCRGIIFTLSLTMLFLVLGHLSARTAESLALVSQQENSKEKPADKPAAMEAESEAWKVSVVSAEKTMAVSGVSPEKTLELWYRSQRMPIYNPDYCLLVLRIRIEYIGPDGEVPTPKLSILDEQDKRHDALETLSVGGDVSQDYMVWLLPTYDVKRSRKKKLKTGEKLGGEGLEYYFGVPKASKKLRLVFADIPAFPLKLKPEA